MEPGSSSGIGMWVAVALLVALSAFLALARTALVNVSRSRLSKLAEQGNRAAALVEAVVEDAARFLTTLETSQALVGFVATALAVWAGVPAVAAVLPRSEGGWLASHGDMVALVVVLALFSLGMLILGWLLPQSLALRHT
ncbi:MAG: DUF21 domain-containing protein, partial [Chloroflexi bacterium]|nr:DUF21 domain-containing protein [Chloroflexota bacterium]